MGSCYFSNEIKNFIFYNLKVDIKISYFKRENQLLWVSCHDTEWETLLINDVPAKGAWLDSNQAFGSHFQFRENIDG